MSDKLTDIQERNFLLGALMYEWIYSIESMKYVVNAVERSAGGGETLWMEERNGKPWHEWDSVIIEKFKSVGASKRVKRSRKFYDCVVKCIEKAVASRGDLMHKIGTEFTAYQDMHYAGHDMERQHKSVSIHIEIVKKHDEPINKLYKTMRRFLEEFKGISIITRQMPE